MVAGSQPHHSSARESVRLGNPFEDAVNLAGSFNPENLVAPQAIDVFYSNLMLMKRNLPTQFHFHISSVG
jgi:hypothetical protein